MTGQKQKSFASFFSDAHYTWIQQRKRNSDFQVALTVAESNICLKCQKNLLGLCRPYRLIWSFSLGSLDSTIRRPRWYDRTPPPPDLLCPLALLLKQEINITLHTQAHAVLAKLDRGLCFLFYLFDFQASHSTQYTHLWLWILVWLVGGTGIKVVHTFENSFRKYTHNTHHWLWIGVW